MVFQLLVFVVSCPVWVSLAFQSLLSVAFHGSLVVGSIVFVLSLGQSPAFSSALAGHRENQKQPLPTDTSTGRDVNLQRPLDPFNDCLPLAVHGRYQFFSSGFG